jgi:hypothetical protein
MTLTPEQARSQANALLAAMFANVSQWDAQLFDQAIEAIAGDGQPFSTNDLREVLPDMGKKAAGLYFRGLVSRQPQLLLRVGEVPSINERAHGKHVNTYVLTKAGWNWLAERQAARNAPQGRAA